jgi:hypothetical protein
MIDQEEHIRKVLNDIQQRVPENLKKNVVRRVYMYPDVRKVMQIAMTDPGVSPEKQNQIRVLFEAGEFDQMVDEENVEIGKLIDKFISREINKEIKKGNLPPRSKLNKLKESNESSNPKRNKK